MKAAGFPEGKDKDGKNLLLNFLTMRVDAKSIDLNIWMASKLKLIGIDFYVKAVQYTKFKELASSGGFHTLEWGWNADYPDPENFLFLFYGSNNKAKIDAKRKKVGDGDGENVANYFNEEYDKLFRQMSCMSDTPKRLRIIRKMINILRRDCPWILETTSVSYILFHSWYKNSKSNLMSHNSIMYRRIDVDEWAKYLEKYPASDRPTKPKDDEDDEKDF